MIVIGDTSGLVAAFNSADPEHIAARDSLAEAALTVISPLVLLEIEHVATKLVGRRDALAINDWILRQEQTGRIAIPAVLAAELRAARMVQNRYAALKLDLTDAVSVVLADKFDTDTVLTLDRRDFRAVVPLNDAAAFRLLPDDR
ncbi:PIN domain-containing protein [Mycolicibacter sp. MYC123]|uniref:PIN domain-containing protein n=1 Tax=[Mycobacterium] zoologicum TaxID=2872311 RepID=A0ABU5YKL7_9MYCO|nr:MULTISPECIES: PIN domain-containing protein [unclassified Mycolicibacter]MEB3050598.1 PIN domain-containing protein [Mycolicibacter sp. MYC123]MEB3063363.1 PIN domain-containing protein [Mycolicibacter sp. MYC101]